MVWNINGATVKEGDLAQLVGLSHKKFIIRITAGAALHTHRGVVQHDDLIGLPWGSELLSHKGSTFYILSPSIADLLQDLPRCTQILYPKDVGFIIMTLGIGPGQHIIEAGTGSGGLTGVFAYLVGESGHVTTHEKRTEFQNLARKNVTRLGLEERVTFVTRDVADGFDAMDGDVLFLDLPNPFDYLHHVRAALKPGGHFGCILPTVNQVTKMLTALRQNDFAFVDVCEILLRYYKPEADKFRPVDRMVSHTGYLIFARPVTPLPEHLKKQAEAPEISADEDAQKMDEFAGEDETEGNELQ